MSNCKLLFVVSAMLFLSACGRLGAPADPSQTPPTVEVTISDEAEESLSVASATEKTFAIEGAPARTYTTRLSESAGEEVDLGDHLTRDRRLDTAADVVLDMAQAGHTLTAPAVQKVLWFFGVAQTSVATTLVAGATTAGVTAKLESWLEEQAEGGDDRYGIAVRRGNRGVRGVALSLSKRMELEPVKTRREKPGPVRIRGRLREPFENPTLVVTSPRGQTRTTALPSKKGAFDQRLKLDRTGRWQLEIMAEGPEGPTALVNFPVAVGLPIDREVTIASGNLESKDPRRLERILFRKLNRARKNHGLEPLEWSGEIAEMARDYSAEMARTGRIAHVSRISGSVSDRVEDAGLELLGVAENIARAGNASEAHAGLMDSPGHRENILSQDAESVGIGVVITQESGGSAVIVTQVFSLGTAEDLEEMGPAEVLELVNAARKSKGRKPLKMDRKLSRQGRGFADGCFGGGAGSRELDLGRYRAVTTVQLMTNDLRSETFAGNGPLMARRVGDVGIAVSSGKSPDTGAPVLCITFLLGKK